MIWILIPFLAMAGMLGLGRKSMQQTHETKMAAMGMCLKKKDGVTGWRPCVEPKRCEETK